MSPPDVVLDVAGIAVAVNAATDDHAGCVHSRLGEARADRPPELQIEIGIEAPAVPDRSPDQQLEGYDGWDDDGAIWIAQDRAAVCVTAGGLALGGPLDTPDAVDSLDNLLQFGTAVAVARPDRLMIHGAVVARGDDALAVIGRSGMGKSTLAGAALLGGWDLLGDDLAVVHPAEPRIRSVARPPMVPGEIADRHGIRGVREKGGRERVTLPVDVLRPGPARLVGVVAVTHGDHGAIERLPGGDPGVLDDALAVPPFRPVIRRQLPGAAAMVALPTFVLAHAADPAVRIERAQGLLDEILVACRDA